MPEHDGLGFIVSDCFATLPGPSSTVQPVTTQTSRPRSDRHGRGRSAGENLALLRKPGSSRLGSRSSPMTDEPNGTTDGSKW